MSTPPRWLQTLHTDGVARLGRLLSDPDLERLRRAWSTLVDDLSERSGMGRAAWLRQILQVRSPHAFHPAFAELAQRSVFRDHAAAALSSAAPRLQAMHMVWRAPLQHTALPWHQDRTTWPPAHADAEPVAIWVALDPTGAESGALRYAPGSHRLTASRAEEPAPRLYAVAAGEALLHTARTWHASGPNGTDQWRRAVIFVFAPS